VRLAIVDIGTNSTRLLIGDVDGGRISAELDRETTVTRLGAGVDESGRLREDAIRRVHDALARYREQIDALGSMQAHAVLTSAVRDASNGTEFAREVGERFGMRTHLIDGVQEASLTYRGATSGRPSTKTGRTLVVDIGGGSTEFVIGSGHHIEFQVSTQAGVVRQTERHIAHDPPAPAELLAVAGDVRSVFDAAVPESRRTGIENAIAVAGTPTSLAAIAQRLDPYDPAKTHGYVLRTAERRAIFVSLATMTLAERQTVPGLQPGRAGVIVPGIVILAEVMDLFDLSSIEISERDILQGALLAAADGTIDAISSP